MKKLITRNILLSGFIFFIILIAQFTLSIASPIIYYASIFFYFSIYLLQALLINSVKSPPQFVAAYNLTIILKMILAIIFLVIYYWFFSGTNSVSENICFSVFYVSTYFIYLVLNVRNHLK